MKPTNGPVFRGVLALCSTPLIIVSRMYTHIDTYIYIHTNLSIYNTYICVLWTRSTLYYIYSLLRLPARHTLPSSLFRTFMLLFLFIYFRQVRRITVRSRVSRDVYLYCCVPIAAKSVWRSSDTHNNTSSAVPRPGTVSAAVSVGKARRTVI